MEEAVPSLECLVSALGDHSSVVVLLATMVGGETVVLAATVIATHGRWTLAEVDVGVRHAGTDVVFLADADIRGLDHETIDAMIGPVASGEVDMFVAMRHRSIYHVRSLLRFLPLLGGERALAAKLWHQVPDRYKHRFKIEVALNFYAVHYGRGLRYRVFEISQTLKEVKHGVLPGLAQRARMAGNVAAAVICLQLVRLAQPEGRRQG